MVVIVWLLDLQLSVHSVPITTKVMSSNHAEGKVYSIQHLCDKVCQWKCFHRNGISTIQQNV
jgi:hypothetical protein